MIGVPKNEMQWLITPTVDMTCKMITLIYISRCQTDSEPLEHMHYTDTSFSYKPLIGEFDFVPDTEIFNWPCKFAELWISVEGRTSTVGSTRPMSAQPPPAYPPVRLLLTDIESSISSKRPLLPN